MRPTSKYFLIRSHGLGLLHESWRQRLSGRFEIGMQPSEYVTTNYEKSSTEALFHIIFLIEGMRP